MAQINLRSIKETCSKPFVLFTVLLFKSRLHKKPEAAESHPTQHSPPQGFRSAGFASLQASLRSSVATILINKAERPALRSSHYRWSQIVLSRNPDTAASLCVWRQEVSYDPGLTQQVGFKSGEKRFILQSRLIRNVAHEHPTHGQISEQVV